MIWHVLIVLIAQGSVFCHPQCTDSRPPFSLFEEESYKTVFCSEYAGFGCCRMDQHMKTQNRTELIKSKILLKKENVPSECMPIIKTLLCQECSPYAAHIYGTETSDEKRSFPGLCKSYCMDFLKKCRDVVKYLTDDEELWALASVGDGSKFCARIAIPDIDYCYPELLTNEILNRQVTKQQSSTEGCLCLEKFADNLRNPLRLIHVPGDFEKIIIAEQVGIVHVYFRNGSKLPEPFLNITSMVLTSGYRGDERGFLGMAFHPNFTQNHLLYIYFSINNKGQAIRISEYKVEAENPNKVDYTTEKTVLEVKQPFWNHNGGEILFGIDGFLYLFLGDGGYKGDPFNLAQNRSVLLGKVLRIDVSKHDDSSEQKAAYSIPSDNPYVNDSSKRAEIYSYGIRNIWRCDIDEGDAITGHGRGRMICGDVGQDAYEEIDVIEKGGNYGWKAYEGFSCYAQDMCGKIGPVVPPIFAYNHTVGKSVTGGHVYRGCNMPSLNGMYIYGDYVSGRLFRLKENTATEKWENQEILMCGSETCFNDLVGVYEKNILSFGEDANGEIYMLTTSHPSPKDASGAVYKFVDPFRRGDPSRCRSKQYSPHDQVPQEPETVTVTSTPSYVSVGVATSLLPVWRAPLYIEAILTVLISSLWC